MVAKSLHLINLKSYIILRAPPTLASRACVHPKTRDLNPVNLPLPRHPTNQSRGLKKHYRPWPRCSNGGTSSAAEAQETVFPVSHLSGWLNLSCVNHVPQEYKSFSWSMISSDTCSPTLLSCSNVATRRLCVKLRSTILKLYWAWKNASTNCVFKNTYYKCPSNELFREKSLHKSARTSVRSAHRWTTLCNTWWYYQAMPTQW